MKNLILTLAALICVQPAQAGLVFAKGQVARKASAPAPQADAADVPEPRSASSAGSNTSLTLGASLPIIGGVLGFGAHLDLGFKVLKNSDWYLGVGGGLNVFPTNPLVLYIPLMLTNRYEFHLAEANVVPYLGLDLGAGVISALGLAGSGFNMMFRPGIKFGSISIEPKFGVIGSGFIFAPTLGFSF